MSTEASADSPPPREKGERAMDLAVASSWSIQSTDRLLALRSEGMAARRVRTSLLMVMSTSSGSTPQVGFDDDGRLGLIEVQGQPSGARRGVLGRPHDALLEETVHRVAQRHHVAKGSQRFIDMLCTSSSGLLPRA